MAQETTNEASKLAAEKEENLEQFNWDNVDPTGGPQFTDDKPKGKSKVEEIVEEEEEVEETDVEEEETEDENEEEEVEVEEEEKKPDEKKKPEPKKKVDTTVEAATEDKEETYSILAEELKEEGILKYVELPKKKKLSHSELLELVGKDTDLAVEAGLKEMFEGLDETGAEFLKYI